MCNFYTNAFLTVFNNWLHFNFIFSGAEAKRTFDEAQTLLARIIKDKLLIARGVVGIYRAVRNGDDIRILSQEEDDIIATMYGLRQQVTVISYGWCHS